ncbi:MAG: hypothetical protein KUG77_16905 [Nannocystaceae bacterium]|nr:hypothetical protein [Nannocystaceae bacterium]
MRLALLAFPLAVFASAGCTPDRCRAENHELSMVLRAVDLSTDDGEEVRVAVDFATGDRASIPISWAKCDGDRILINGQDARESTQEDRTEYTLTFDGEDGDVVTIELDRATQDSVITASIERPPRFEVLSPEPGAQLPRSEATELGWTPAAEGGEMQVELQEELGGGRCIVSDEVEHDYKGHGGVRVEDTGMWTIPASVLTNDGELRCDARYLLRRFARGEYPEGLAKGGFVQAEVLRIVLFESVP